MRAATLPSASARFAIGQRVHSILYGGRDGIVYRIHGEQAPESVHSMAGGAMVTGGRAHLDIVFENGSVSRMIPESIVRGVQWRIFDSVATPDEINRALSFAEQEGARKETEMAQANARRAQEREQHARAYPHLSKKADKPQWSPGRLAASNIRIELKKHFPGVKFKVTSDHNSVDVRWTDGPTSESVKKIVEKYQAGYFDGMTDCYESNIDATFADVFGDPKYVFTHREETVAGLRTAWERAGRNPAEVPDDWASTCWKLPDNLAHFIREQWSKTAL